MMTSADRPVSVVRNKACITSLSGNWTRTITRLYLDICASRRICRDVWVINGCSARSCLQFNSSLL